jgi:hypothetical protein
VQDRETKRVHQQSGRRKKESKIFDKQIKKRKSTNREVIAWRYSMIKLPRIGLVDKKNTGMWNKVQGKTKRQRILKD